MYQTINNYKAFTLIELLVVIAIIGLLSSVVLASLSGARESARDARRVSDFNQIRTAVNLYRNDHGGDFPGGGDSYGVQVSSDCTSTNFYQDLVGGGYLSSMPTDPSQTLEICDGRNSETLQNGNVDDEYFYAWDSSNAGGHSCFAINRFESSEDAGSLQGLNAQPGISFGGNANLSEAAFVFCFSSED